MAMLDYQRVPIVSQLKAFPVARLANADLARPGRLGGKCWDSLNPLVKHLLVGDLEFFFLFTYILGIIIPTN